jgi:large subunit ribosomal protein L31
LNVLVDRGCGLPCFESDDTIAVSPDVTDGELTWHFPARTWDMKEGIHPNYVDTAVTCGCGNTFSTRSVRSELKVDICNMCHPFFTGKLKYIDTAGRIEKFQSKFAAGSYASLQKSGKKKSAKAKADS